MRSGFPSAAKPSPKPIPTGYWPCALGFLNVNSSDTTARSY